MAFQTGNGIYGNLFHLFKIFSYLKMKELKISSHSVLPAESSSACEAGTPDEF